MIQDTSDQHFTDSGFSIKSSSIAYNLNMSRSFQHFLGLGCITRELVGGHWGPKPRWTTLSLNLRSVNRPNHGTQTVNTRLRLIFCMTAFASSHSHGL